VLKLYIILKAFFSFSNYSHALSKEPVASCA